MHDAVSASGGAGGACRVGKDSSNRAESVALNLVEVY